uniref:Uncharacterized protein n=1 Tax=Cucumis melo TaxID=3656 RepID=A0A9I9EMC4_CUCME
MQMFRKGPFGHLLDVQIKKCPGQLLFINYKQLPNTLEIIPKLSESPNGIAARIGHRSLRIINWKLEQQPVWTYLQRNYCKSSDFTVIPFTPTSDELISPNFQFFLNDQPNEVEKE